MTHLREKESEKMDFGKIKILEKISLKQKIREKLQCIRALMNYFGEKDSQINVKSKQLVKFKYKIL